MYLDVLSALVALACGNLGDARSHLSKARRRWRTEFSTYTGAETVMLAVGTLLAFERGNVRQVRQLLAQVGHRLVRSEAWLDIYFAVYDLMFRSMARDHGLPSALVAIERSKRQLPDAGLDRIANGLGNIGVCLAGERILQGDTALSLSNHGGGPAALGVLAGKGGTNSSFGLHCFGQSSAT
jgi:hypothetical protein